MNLLHRLLERPAYGKCPGSSALACTLTACAALVVLTSNVGAQAAAAASAAAPPTGSESAATPAVAPVSINAATEPAPTATSAPVAPPVAVTATRIAPANAAPQPIAAAAAAQPAASQVDGSTDQDSDDTDSARDEAIVYVPREGLDLHADHVRARLRLIVQTVLRGSGTVCPDGTASCPDATTEWNVRRARAGLDVRLPHHVRLNFEVQVKNQILVVKNAYLAYHRHSYELSAGLVKPPGGLERDASTFDKPFVERSVIANLTHDRELGVRLIGSAAKAHIRYGLSAARPRAAGLDAAEPEDVKAPPVGVEADDLTLEPGMWNFAGRVAYVPSDAFEIGIAAGTFLAPEVTLGEATSEPYEVKLFEARPWSGANVHGSVDAALAVRHARVMAEVGAWRDGAAKEFPPPNPPLPDAQRGHFHAIAGYLTFGLTPDGEYGPAIDAAPLLSGWEWVNRVEALAGSPGDVGGTGRFVGVTSGVAFIPFPQLRLQTDVGYQWFGAHVDPHAASLRRVWVELWAQGRL